MLQTAAVGMAVTQRMTENSFFLVATCHSVQRDSSRVAPVQNDKKSVCVKQDNPLRHLR